MDIWGKKRSRIKFQTFSPSNNAWGIIERVTLLGFAWMYLPIHNFKIPLPTEPFSLARKGELRNIKYVSIDCYYKTFYRKTGSALYRFFNLDFMDTLKIFLLLKNVKQSEAHINMKKEHPVEPIIRP